MTQNIKVNAAIIIIGNEILSGRTIDANTSTLAIWLNSLGVNLNEVRVIPDIEKKIVYTINELRKKFDYVFTTGGIGPTHDDITANSISKAFGVEYSIHPEAFSATFNQFTSIDINETLVEVILLSDEERIRRYNKKIH